MYEEEADYGSSNKMIKKTWKSYSGAFGSAWINLQLGLLSGQWFFDMIADACRSPRAWSVHDQQAGKSHSIWPLARTERKGAF